MKLKKIIDHDKNITTPEINKLTKKYFSLKLAQANLAGQSVIANFTKMTSIIN